MIFVMLDEYNTLPKRLKEYSPGYTTALLRKSHTGSNMLDAGFDIYDFQMNGYAPPGEDPAKIYSTVNRANAFMESNVQADTPFFLMVASSAVHAPYEYSTEAYDELLNYPLGARHRSRQFASMLYDFDKSIGQMLDKIEQLGIAENTYVIFTSDNGGNTGARTNEPLFGGKGSLWEGGIRVPFIVSGPGITAGSVSNVPVVGTDIFATVSDLAGITTPFEDGIESASLKPVLHNNGQLPEGVNLERGYGSAGELFFHFPHYTPTATPVSSVRDGDFKLLKLHGVTSASDQVFLFNLTDNITESSNVSSSLNLASSMPAKTSELLGKLNGWLGTVDAAMPHLVAENVHLLWDATEVGANGLSSLWRSKNRVGDLRRESWELVPPKGAPGPIPVDQIAQQVNISPHQPGLGNKAFEFTGNDVMTRSYFHVSDNATGQWDNSASFEFWLRPNDLGPNKPQTIFETDGANAGLSLSLGDADADGKSNDLRFRVRGSSGIAYTLTVPIDEFADPTIDFIHAAAVINDSDDNRSIKLYLNGALRAVAQGVLGASGRIDWDLGDPARLGGPKGEVGGNGGPGELPFIGGYEGDLAEMSFFNYALSSSDIQDSYNAKLAPVNTGITSISGQVSVPSIRPTDVSRDVFESSNIRIMHERSDVLHSSLSVDAIVNGVTILSAADDAVPGILPEGTAVSSYLLHFDSENITSSVAGTINFEKEILGIFFEDDSLTATDSLLGTIGAYEKGPARGWDTSSGGLLSVSSDRLSLQFNFAVDASEMLQLRVLTAFAGEPEFLPADFDQDGLVNSADLEIWQSSYGVDAGGDANSDGMTDGRDFLIWQRLLAGGAHTAEQISVPEPTTAALWIVGLLTAVLCRRRTI